MRQVNADELAYTIQGALRGVSASLMKEAQHHDADTRIRARMRIAGQVVAVLSRYEVLSDTPEPPPFRLAAVSGVSGIGGTFDGDA